MTGASLLTLALAALAAVADAAEPRLLYGFDDPADLKGVTTNHADAAIDGGRLALTFHPPAGYPGARWTAEKPWDWRGFGGMALDVTNPGPESIAFCLRIDDHPAAGDGRTHSRTRSIRIPPGRGMTVLMPFDADPLAGDMATLPGYALMGNALGGGAFNLRHIVGFTLFSVKPSKPVTLLFDNLRLIPEQPPFPLRTDTQALASFEDPADLAGMVTNAAAAALEDGRLRMRFGVAAWPAVKFNFARPREWRGYGGLAMDLVNPGRESVRFAVRIDDDPSADGRAHCRTGTGVLEAGESATVLIPFGIDPLALGMKTLPGFTAMRSLGSSGAGPFNYGHITGWQVFLAKPGAPRELALDNVRLIPGQRQDYERIVDAFGLYTRAQWPGKLTRSADFAPRRAAEEAELAAAPSLPDRNRFGGWTRGPRLRATGFFRTEKVGGKWSLVDPEGLLFFSTGLDTISPAAYTMVTSRETLFATLPADDPVLARHVRNDQGERVDFYGANLERKYGPDYLAAWRSNTLARLPAWGFNTIGAFSSWSFNTNGRVPYCVTVWPGGGHARVPSTGGTLADPFDPAFSNAVTAAARQQALAVKDDPFCLGYFVGNEEHWGSPGSPRSRYALAFGALGLEAGKSPAKRAFLAQLQAAYPDIAALNAAWGTAFAGWSTLGEPGEPLSPSAEADLSLFLKTYADRYFRAVRDALKALDPNHLYLGCRFAGYTREILEGAAAHTDVMSFNIYRLRIDPAEWDVLKGIDHPVLVGEFHFGAADRGMFDSGLVPVTDQAARSRAYLAYVNSVLDHPLFVGCHWFQYADQPLTGRDQDGENGNVGFVDVTDTPYPELVGAARAAHAAVYDRRFGDAGP